MERGSLLYASIGVAAASSKLDPPVIPLPLTKVNTHPRTELLRFWRGTLRN
jgi:hypothetical protein